MADLRSDESNEFDDGPALVDLMLLLLFAPLGPLELKDSITTYLLMQTRELLTLQDTLAARDKFFRYLLTFSTPDSNSDPWFIPMAVGLSGATGTNFALQGGQVMLLFVPPWSQHGLPSKGNRALKFQPIPVSPIRQNQYFSTTFSR